MCVVIQLNSSKEEKILYYQAKFCYKRSLKWRNYSYTYMVHTKLTVKSPEKHLQEVGEAYCDSVKTEYVIGKVLYIQPLIRP